MNNRFHVYLLILFIHLIVEPAFAAPPTGATSLGDLSTTHQARGSYPRDMIQLGDKFFFSARTEMSGDELWVSDGTTAGTVLLKDIYPGIHGSQIRNLSKLGDSLVFTAMNQNGFSLLWKTDGTEEGTAIVSDSKAGAALSVSKLVTVGEFAYMSATEDASGYEEEFEVWRYSIRTDELVQITDFGSDFVGAFPNNLKVVEDRVLFNAGFGVYVIEPSALGAVPFEPPGVQEFWLTTYMPFTKFEDHYYFGAQSSSTGAELWRTDGTEEGTSIVVDLSPGARSSAPAPQVIYRGELYFTAKDDNHRSQLFATDGTEDGTRLIKSQSALDQALEPNWSSKSNVPSAWPLEVLSAGVSEDTLFFTGLNTQNSYLLWRSDGTVAGSSALRTPYGFEPYSRLTLPFTHKNQQLLYFLSNSNVTGWELWRVVDGKSVEPFGEFHPRFWDGVGEFVVFNDRLIMALSTPQTGSELWELGDTPETTRLLANIMPDDTADSSISSLVETDTGVVFLGPGGKPDDAGIWRTDGTPDNTVQVKEFEAQTHPNGYSYAVSARSLKHFNSKTTFSVYDYNYSGNLGQWTISGENVTKIGEQPMGNLVPFGDKMIANVNGDLWGTTGVVGSVQRITTINDTAGGLFIDYIHATNNQLWFYSVNQASGESVWRSNGSISGTQLVTELTYNNFGSKYQALGPLGDDLLFMTAKYDGVKLWRTGSSGAVFLARLTDYWDWRDPLYNKVTRLGEKFLISFTTASGKETDLWATDGTLAGTARLGQILPGEWLETQTRMTVLGERVYFAGYDDVHGITLWHSDGTKEGTGMAIDFEPGFHLFTIQEPVAHNGSIYVVANTSTSGEEIWEFDGERATQVTELMTGTLSASPRGLTSVGNRLYFIAYVLGQGRELNVLDITEP